MKAQKKLLISKTGFDLITILTSKERILTTAHQSPAINVSRVGLAIMEGELNFDSVKSSEGEEETKGRAGSQVNEEVPLQQGPSEITGQVKLNSCNKGPSEKEPEKKMGIITGEEANHSVEEFVESLATREVLG
ncbi:uncharacterized protein LOC144545955 [Carex rostrata]